MLLRLLRASFFFFVQVQLNASWCVRVCFYVCACVRVVFFKACSNRKDKQYPGYKWIIFARGAKGLFGMFIEAWIGWRMSHLQLDHTTCITFSVGTSRAFCRNRVSTGEPSQFCRTRISTGLASPGLLVKFYGIREIPNFLGKQCIK